LKSKFRFRLYKKIIDQAARGNVETTSATMEQGGVWLEKAGRDRSRRY
jgi:hypothetical protein